MTYLEFGFQLLYPLHTIYVMVVQILSLSTAFVLTAVLREAIHDDSLIIYIAYGVISVASVILALFVRTYFLPI